MNIFMKAVKPIHSCDTYQPYWTKNEDGERVKNPKNNVVSKKLMDLKDEQNSKHAASVSFFSKMLSNRINELGLNRYFSATQSGVAILVVPSSQKGKVSPALMEIAKYAARQHNLSVYVPNPLTRTRTIQKLHSGGDRSISVHLGSIRVEQTFLTDLRYKRVIIMDDVSTTGGSLHACSQLLQSEGIESNNIELISLLKTA
ncbi:hypothetical protein FCV71_18460 [Vibrio lentus]|uniref:ComF family protein n=1 Tax=Vibrio lentus TaxID=136468 RepID=UPI0010BD024F|nr:hypothetical protein [Vibrio lentus]TKF94991.1 hypothetical protein FCV71_18460 [Vibrio lentus]